MSSCLLGLSSRAFGLIVRYSKGFVDLFLCDDGVPTSKKGQVSSHCIDLCKIELQGIIFISTF